MVENILWHLCGLSLSLRRNVAYSRSVLRTALTRLLVQVCVIIWAKKALHRHCALVPDVFANSVISANPIATSPYEPGRFHLRWESVKEFANLQMSSQQDSPMRWPSFIVQI